MVLATALAAVVSVVSLIAIGRVDWPAFPSSNQLHALTTVGQFVCLIALFGAGWLWRRGRRGVAWLTSVVFLTAFVVATLGMPLGATRLYLHGISVDQQFRTEYVIPTPDSWTQNWVVVAAEVGSEIMLDGATTNLCQIEPAGMVEGKTYHSRKCPLQPGVHRLSGDKPFGIIAYGYGSAGSYAFAGGADVKRVYEPPPLK